MMKMTDYTLPEFCFLEAHQHQGNLLDHRTVLQHIRSYTILEVVHLEEVFTSQFKEGVRTFEFTHTNLMGIKESILFLVHFTLAEQADLEDIFQKCKDWYCDYLNWEDGNIEQDGLGSLN
jgi:hypothetical protein